MDTNERTCTCGAIVKYSRKASKDKAEKEGRGCRHCRKKPFSSLLSRAKARAGKKDIPFNLSNDFLEGLYLGQAKLCYFSKKPLTEKDASIDRLDSSKGYTKNNVVLCSKEANYAKHTMTENEFLNLCETIAYAVSNL